MKEQILAKIAELVALVNSLPEPGELEARIVALEAQVAQLQADLVAKDAIIAEQAGRLAQADLLAKQIDALSPDA